MSMGSADPTAIQQKAKNAQLMGILGIVFSLCCGLIGLILGIIAINNGNTALKMIEESGIAQEFASQANTGKICGIIAIVVAALNILGGIAINLGGVLGN